MQERSSHKAIKSPQSVSSPRAESVSAPKVETVSAPVRSSYWFPGDETHVAVYIDAFTEAEAHKLYDDYLKR